MEADLTRDPLRLFEGCIAQIRSEKPGPNLLVSPEFEATLTTAGVEVLRLREMTGRAKLGVEPA